MPKFENFNNDGESKDEMQRLYGNDISPKVFSAGRAYKNLDDFPNDTGLYGENGNSELELARDISEELKEKLDYKIDDGALLALGKECDDYLNNKGRLPANVNEDEARKLALMYRESSEYVEPKEKREPVTPVRRTKLVNLFGRVARAFPDDKSEVELDRKSHQAHQANNHKKSA